MSSPPSVSCAEVLPQLTGTLGWRFHQPQAPEENYTVPKRAHFIWYHSPCPDEFRNNIQRCRELNPDYEIILWTNWPQEPIHGVDIRWFEDEELRLQDVREHFREHLGAYGDLLRYPLIYKFGGVYFDTDYEFYKPLDERFTRSFVCSEPHNWRNICAGCFGFPAGSQFLDYVIRCVPENMIVHAPTYSPEIAGPAFLTTCLVQYSDPRITDISQRFVGAEDPTGITPQSEVIARHTGAYAWGTQQLDYGAIYQRLRRASSAYVVVIPTYNRYDLCLRAVRSALTQTHPPTHVIVVNDASPDQRYADLDLQFNDPRLIVYHLRENCRTKWQVGFAVGAVRNFALELITQTNFSGWVGFLDDDDEWLPNKMELQLAAAQAFPEYKLVCSNAYTRHLNGDDHGPFHGQLGQQVVGKYYDLSDVMAPNPVINCTAVMHTDIVRKIGLQQHTGYGEDYNYWLHARQYTRVLRVDECLAHYCVGNTKYYSV